MPHGQLYEMLRPEELKRNFPNASRSTIERNMPGGERLRSSKPERAERLPLERAGKGKEKGGHIPVQRYRITFAVYSRRPLDWDNYRLKDIQDCLIEAGLLPDDNWRVLEGCVISKKAHTAEEEGTHILIEPL